MGTNTKIEWTDATWNPLRGCSPVSAGCKNCYASRNAKRFSGPGAPFEGLVRINAAGERTDEWNGQVHFIEKHLLDPMKWKPFYTTPNRGEGRWNMLRPRRIFVNSVSDLFIENVPDEWIDRIFAVMALCPQHIFQVLTKRPERMRDYLTRREESGQKWRIEAIVHAALKIAEIAPRPAMVSREHFDLWPLPNVWLGVSVENQAVADERREPIKVLAAIGWQTFVSSGPRLGPIDWDGWEFIRWLITEGESGFDARPMAPDWPRSDLRWSQTNHIPFFFKQWGEWVPTDDPDIAKARGIPFEECMSYVGKKVAGSLLDGVEYKEFPNPQVL